MNSRKFLRKEQQARAIKIRKSYGGDGTEKIGIRIPPETRLALSFWALETPPSRVPKVLNMPEVQAFEAARGNKLSVKMIQGALTDFYRNIDHVILLAAMMLEIKFESREPSYVRRVVREALERDMKQLDQDSPNWRDMQP